MPRRGPERTPSQDPPPDGRHLLLAARPWPAGPLGGILFRVIAGPPRIYVTGHRNPDTDSIASAVGYAELNGRLDTRNQYVPVRLGHFDEDFPHLAPLLATPCDFLVMHKDLRLPAAAHHGGNQQK